MALLRSNGLLAVCLLLLCTIAHAIDTLSTSNDTYGASNDTPWQTYLSAPSLKPPEILVTKAEQGLADGLVFVGVNGEPASTQNVPCIFDMSLGPRLGSLVWTGLNYTEPFDFRVQSYNGTPHLTFWAGRLLNGYGHGSYYILDQTYTIVANFTPPGFPEGGDIHEFTITANDTALIDIYTPRQTDLSSVGGASDGWIFDCIIQEVNITTNQTLFTWSAFDHVGLTESYNTISGAGTQSSPFDYFHLNSAYKDPAGDYLVSARGMDTVYKISGKDGSIIWRLNGKKSDFKVDDVAKFAFQHDARWINDTTQTRLTLFDNGANDKIKYSRGLLLDVDQSAKTVKLLTEFENGPRTFGQFEGNLQPINASNETTNYFVGFGSQPFFTETSSNGSILLDAKFSKTNQVNSYRAYKFPWVGLPSTNPDVVYVKDGAKVYFSWNGATEVENWVVYTADMADSPTWVNITTAYRTGFETEVYLSKVAGLKNLVRGEAISDNGTSLGWTDATDGTSFFSVGSNNGLRRAAASATPTMIAATPSPTKGAASISLVTNSLLALVAAISVGTMLFA
ncbi:MAG: hypothetical protein M1812_006491 [Candelaria pacifica]|nr:MAG: hypothetical protein M1812_006491 [Candelaria pacifica]